ncbi:hypothetical protein LBMAG53_00380 [Planctomycetota bacterium]|nr:hypothetical protein LBMAG53_00380 [Planctomycetota bacterium]
MTKLLLILILFSDPTSEPAAAALAARLGPATGARIVVGREAGEELAKRGVSDGDVATASARAAAATTIDRGLAIVRFERRDVGDNRVLEARLVLFGKFEGHTALAGKTANEPPTAETDLATAAAVAVSRLLAPHLPANSGAEIEEPALAELSRKANWTGLAEVVEARPATGRSPRAWHFLVLADCRLGRIEAAKAALAAMAVAHPGHVLLASAKELIAGAEEPLGPKPAAGDDGGNVLR